MHIYQKIKRLVEAFYVLADMQLTISPSNYFLGSGLSSIKCFEIKKKKKEPLLTPFVINYARIIQIPYEKEKVDRN